MVDEINYRAKPNLLAFNILKKAFEDKYKEINPNYFKKLPGVYK